MPEPAPRDEYERRLAARRRDHATASAGARRISNARLAVFAAGIALVAFAFGWKLADPRWLAVPVAGFVALVVAHERALRRRVVAERAVRYYEDGVARLDGAFAGRGPSGERFRDPEHPYADDLDVFGAGSLFDLLCRARTAAGEAKLAGWLLAPAPPDVVRERQGAVAELARALDLREALSGSGDDVAAGLHPASLLHWGANAPAPPSRAVRVALAALAALSVALVAGILLGVPDVPLLIPWLGVLIGGALLAAAQRSRVRRVVRETDAAARELELLARLLAHVETASFEAPRLRALQASIAIEGVPASQRIRRLARLLELLDARRNQFFAPIGAALFFTTQVALAIDAWRAACGPRLPDWLDAVAEMEALASLATHAGEHPDDVFPSFVEGAPCFVAEAAGHPLLPADRCVRNDVSLGEAPAVLLVSGSNMSGKSTLLRTVGVAALLGQAGAAVRARSLRMTPLAVGASLRVFDSLQAGHSHFYAEIRRLRAVVGLTESPHPVLFLLDEILHGTNSHDRRIGAEAVVRSLVARGAIGLVTTHDLALARIADELAPRAANVHFEDQIVDGRMSFDYRMRPGVVTRSNALELMRAVGLEV
jgi:hypothetical protein